MRLYFARHGHNDANTNTPVNEDSGEIDEPLNAEGVMQANDLAEQLKDVHFDAIITSPLKRAYQTADVVNKYHSLPVEINEALRERGTGRYLELDTWGKMFDFENIFTFENCEDIKDFFNRIYAAIDEIKYEYADKTVLVVSHAGVHVALNAYVNELPLSGNVLVTPLKNCEYRIYELDS